MTYACLFAKSNYSFLEGASHPEELVETAFALGLKALALTDRDGVYGVVRAHVRAKELGIKLIVGSELTMEDGSTLVLLVQDRRGYAHLCQIITRGRMRRPKGSCEVHWEDVFELSQGLVALWGGERSALARNEIDGRLLDAMGARFEGRLYGLWTRHLVAEEEEGQARVRERARRMKWPIVPSVEVLYHQRSRRPLQDVLTCIREKTTLTEAGRHIRPNAEQELLAPEAFRRRFEGLPEACERTVAVAEACTFSLDELVYAYPREHLPTGHTVASHLRAQTYEGARKRYAGEIPDDVRSQLEHELEVIEALDYGGYFLTMKELVEFCQREEIVCQGRGSAANSAVCFCLGITAVDPVRMGLLFERFLSKERAEPPDIDLDIAHERREEVIQYVYARYGRDRAAMVANVIRYRPKSAVREVGKVMGLGEAELDRLARMLSHRGRLEADVFVEAGMDPDTPRHRLVARLTNELLDFPRHLSIHPGGFLLASGPVYDFVPIENATMEQRTVIQWDKYDVEALNLFKLDLLGLGALSQIDRAFRLIEVHRSEQLSMATIPKDDEATFDMICRAETVGVFQIESRAQMAMLPRLKPRTYYDLVIEVSLVRPGPITGDMVHPYLRRRQGLEPIEYPHESLEPVLRRTLGIPLFQEQVMRLAVVAADYTPGEADQLRRDMAAWRQHGRIERHRERLIGRMIEKGIEAQFAERVFEQIKGFADYGFPESHAASFALISYATAYLRCHYPVEFVCSLLNAQPMGFYSPSTLIEDARRMGVEILPIDVTRSDWDCSMEPGGLRHGFSLRMGLRYLKGFRRESGQAIVDGRKHRPYEDLDDFVGRTSLARDDLLRLAESGALDPFARDRRWALWRVKGLVGERRAPLELPLYEPEEEIAFEALSLMEVIRWDYRTSFHSTRGHPLKPLRGLLRRMGLKPAEEISTGNDGARVEYAGLVICRQRPSTASGVVFMTLEDETGFMNLVVWPKIFEQFGPLIRTTPFIGVWGKLQVQDGVVHLIADGFFELRGQAAMGRRSRDWK
jgi:error-prone DNA polymerase